MIPYRFDEIENKHVQRVYMFSKQPGNNDLEKCINFINRMGVGFDRYDTKTIQGDDITIIVTAKSAFEVFNSAGEKIGECDTYVSNNQISSLSDMHDDLNDLGINVI